MSLHPLQNDRYINNIQVVILIIKTTVKCFVEPIQLEYILDFVWLNSVETNFKQNKPTRNWFYLKKLHNFCIQRELTIHNVLCTFCSECYTISSLKLDIYY